MSPSPSIQAAFGYRAQYDLAFQISPIVLQGGIAASAQGGLLPIISITGGPTDSAQDAFAIYLPLPGSTLISQAVGMYPFANQAIAANATIQQPLTLSMVMIAPVNQSGGYLTKLQAFSALQQALAQHNAAGGTYIVATPAFVYQNMLLTAMTDITPEISAEDASKQVQIQYQLDFVQPIITQQQAQGQLNNLMQKVANGAPISNATWSGQGGASPATLTGITGALANVEEALSTFGGTL